MKSPPSRNPPAWFWLATAGLCCLLSFVFGLWRDTRPYNDLFAPYQGIQQFVFHRTSPYSPQVTREIQSKYYGHVIDRNEHKDEQRFAYPFYSIVLLWPIAFLKYETLKAVALPLLIAGIALYSWLSCSLMRWPLSTSGRLTLALCFMASAPVIRGLRLEQLTIVVALLLLLAFIAAEKNRLTFAGLLLAAATIKPQIALVPILWLLIWAVSSWNARKRLLYAFFVAEAVLFLASELLLPSWPLQFADVVFHYGSYTGANSMLTMLLGVPVGLALSLTLAAGLSVAVVHARRCDAVSMDFRLSSAYALGFAAIAMPALAAQHNQILLLPAFCAAMASWKSPNRQWAVPLLAAFSPAAIVAAAIAHNPDFMMAARVAFWMGLPIAIITVTAVLCIPPARPAT